MESSAFNIDSQGVWDVTALQAQIVTLLNMMSLYSHFVDSYWVLLKYHICVLPLT